MSTVWDPHPSTLVSPCLSPASPQGSPDVRPGPGQKAESLGEGQGLAEFWEGLGKDKETLLLKFKQLDNLFWIDLEALK